MRNFYSEELLNVDPNGVEKHWMEKLLAMGPLNANKEIEIRLYETAAMKIQNMPEDEKLMKMYEFDAERAKERDLLLKGIFSEN